jgi:tetratricopeptide (TPR) repeat protein/tRNA A-37 threonylcarbamoyl transferase component Bud32
MGDSDHPSTTATAPASAGAAYAPPSLFAPGDFVADRYRIVSLRGRGGMGEVYEAEDLELGTRIALKTLRAGTLSDERAVERLKRELLLARRITHPNVCRLFDVGQHQSEDHPVVFLTMELLEGETLAAVIRRRGRLPLDEAAALCGRMAEALDAAHASGVVHRDFKSSNVVLCADGRVVVTDFGLARALAPDEGALVSTDAFAGSPAYMAPEQVEGDPISERTDVYAFGVVLFEMTTGTLPFVGETPLATAVKRLKHPPPTPSALAPGVDPTWEATVLRCLERKPADRFPNCGAAVAALRGAQLPREVSRRWKVALVGVTALLLAGVVSWKLLHRGAAPQASTGAHQTVALLSLQGVPADHPLGWIATGLPNMLESELSRGDRWRAVAGETVARMTRDFAIPAGDLTQPTIDQLRDRLGADAIVLGRVAPGGSGNRLHLSFAVYDAKKRAVRGRIDDDVDERDIFDAATRIGEKLRSTLGERTLAATDRQPTAGAHSRNAEAEKLYAEGMDRYRRLDLTGAKPLLERAVIIDPNFALAHSALGSVLSSLGFDDRARVEAHRALDLASGLSKEEQLRLQSGVHVAEREWSKAAEVARQLWTMAPENREYGLALVIALAFSGNGKEAITTIDEVRRRAGGQEDPMIDLREAMASEAVTDYERELKAANRAYEAARKRGERGMIPEACYFRGGSYIGMGKYREAIAPLEEARQNYEELGDRGGVGYILSALAETRVKFGEFDQAIRDAQQALAIFRETGDQLHLAWNTGTIGHIYELHGDRAQAVKYYEQALAMFRARGDKKGVQAYISNMGAVLSQQGRLTEAEGMFREAATIARELARPEDVAINVGNLADLKEQEGELAEASRLADEAIGIARQMKSDVLTGAFLTVRGAVLTDMHDLPAAHAALDEAVGIMTRVGDLRLLSDTKRELAELALAEGRLDEADRRAREVAEAAAKRGDDDSEAKATEVRVRALLAAGRLDDAAAALRRLSALVTASDDRVLQLRFALTNARMVVKRLGQKRAEAEVRRVDREARKNGLLGIRLEAELILAGRDKAARAQVAAEARRLGFGRIAAEATAD